MNDLRKHGPATPALLLVSVKHQDEACVALEEHVDLLDIKDPVAGSLGMADPLVIQHISAEVQSALTSMPISCALGELIEWGETSRIPALPENVGYLKLGLSQMKSISVWKQHWMSLRTRFEETLERSFIWVAVCYADENHANSPPFEEIMQAAIETSCQVFLIDTFLKDSRSLLDYFDLDLIADVISRIQSAGMLAALAGRLQFEQIRQLLPFNPDIIAVRSAVCTQGHREGGLNRTAIRELKTVLESQSGIDVE